MRTERGALPLHQYFIGQTERLIERSKKAGISGPVIEQHLFRLGSLQDKLDGIMAEFEEHGFGIVLQGRGSWAVLMADPSEPGRVRYQTFDEKGFSGHVTRSHIEEVILDAFNSGYRKIAENQNILDDLSRTEKWARGTLATHLIQQVNMGLISFTQATELFDKQFGSALV